MITGPDRFHFASGQFNDTRPFMAQHQWSAGWFPVVHHADIRVAYATGNNSDKRFRILRTIHIQDFDFERTILFAHNGCPNLEKG